MKYPDIHGLKLSKSSKKAIEQLRLKIDCFKLGNKLLALSPFLVLLGSHPIPMVVTILTTDWDNWVEAISGLPVWQRKNIRSTITFSQRYEDGLSAKERKFWEAIDESFR